MQNNLDRAKQFLPFDALKGFRKALEEKEKIYENKKDLSDDYFHNLDIKIKNVKKDMNVRIKYYHDLEYIETTGVVKKIDKKLENILKEMIKQNIFVKKKKNK